MSDCTCGRDDYDGPGKPFLAHAPGCPEPNVQMKAYFDREPIIRYAHLAGGERVFDEFVADNATVHFEVMGDNHWWMQIDVGGRSWHINCGNDRARSMGFARCDEVTA